MGEGTLANAPPEERPRKRAKVAAAVDVCDKPAVDFFGRLITVPEVGCTKPSSSRKPAEKPYRVAYRHKEGNSAAVRKPVKMSSFL